MAGREDDDIVSVEMKALKEMVGTLAQSVQVLASRQSAPADSVKKSEALTSQLEFQQRCLKRERDCDSKKQGIVKQQNLLDELKTKVKAASAAAKSARVVVLKDPSADLNQPVDVELKAFTEMEEGIYVLSALDATEKLISARLLDLSVVCAASTNAIGWSVVESLTGSQWRDYCEDEKQALAVKDALTEHEKRAVTASDRAAKEADRKAAGFQRNGYKGRRGGYQPSTYTADGMMVPPPPPGGGPDAERMRPGSAAAGMAARPSTTSGASFHSQNDWCYKCTRTGHRSNNCPNPPAPGRY
jgi:hypothetical protein